MNTRQTGSGTRKFVTKILNTRVGKANTTRGIDFKKKCLTCCACCHITALHLNVTIGQNCYPGVPTAFEIVN